DSRRIATRTCVAGDVIRLATRYHADKPLTPGVARFNAERCRYLAPSHASRTRVESDGIRIAVEVPFRSAPVPNSAPTILVPASGSLMLPRMMPLAPASAAFRRIESYIPCSLVEPDCPLELRIAISRYSLPTRSAEVNRA